PIFLWCANCAPGGCFNWMVVGTPQECSFTVGSDQDNSMRLLVFDEVCFRGSMETLCLNLLPALSRFCEILVWVVPNYLHQELANHINDAPRLLLEGHNWPRWSMRWLPQRLLRKANPSLSGAVGQAAARSVRDARIRALAKKHRCTHFLTSYVC